MSTNGHLSPAEIAAQRDAFIERFFGFASGTFNIFAIYLGDRLGLYRALAEGGPFTSSGLASRTGTHERYIREWLEQQAVAGVIQVEDETAESANRRYFLPPGHSEVLIDCTSLNYLAPMAQLLVGATRPITSVLDAFRTGAGVPYGEYGPDLLEGQAAINCPAFTTQLAGEWIPSMPDVHARLLQDPPARVADIGCGCGWSSIGLAQGYPRIRVDGYDLDAPSIERARLYAVAWKLAGRVRFHLQDASDPALEGSYDLVTAFECVHDMSDPVGALRSMRRLAGERGSVLIADERVNDAFTAKGEGMDWMMYGWSVLHCLPVGMTGENPAGTGTVMRSGTLKGYASQAGFSRVEVLPIDNDFFRFYRLNA